jgi:hypothetical protein
VKKRREVLIDADGFVYADGVKVARRIERDGKAYLQFRDKCKRRSSERGSDIAEVSADVFDRIILDGPCPPDLTY